MSSPVRIGAWTCRSGNGVDVFLVRQVEGTYVLRLEWDSTPPLSVGHQCDYDRMILPAIVGRAQEFTKRPRPALVVRV